MATQSCDRVFDSWNAAGFRDHTALFEHCLNKTVQVRILLRTKKLATLETKERKNSETAEVTGILSATYVLVILQ